MNEHNDSKIQITLAHLSLPGQCLPYFYWAVHILAAIQSLSLVLDSRSTLYLVFAWADPSNYLPTSFLTVFAAVYALLLLAASLARYVWTQQKLPLVKATLALTYIDRIIYLGQLSAKTYLLIPFLRSFCMQLKQPTGFTGAALTGLLTYLLILFPFLMVTSLGTGALTPHFDNKITNLNGQLLHFCFKIVWVFTSVYSSTATVVFSGLFAFFSLVLLVKRPIFSFNYNKFKTILVSLGCFACLLRLGNAAQGTPQGSITIQLFGMICFPALIEVISRNRIKSIIGQDKKTVYQFKVLMYMLAQVDYYRELLELYIIHHQKSCVSSICRCKNVVNLFALKETESNQQKVWYQFLACYFEEVFDLKMIAKLPKSEMIAKTTKYTQVVFQLAEIHLFKLKSPNKAYLLIDNYYAHLVENGLEATWSPRRYRFFTYYLQQAMLDRVKTSTTINVHTNKFLHFQVEFTKYFDLLRSTAEKAVVFWEEMGKKEPGEPEIQEAMGYFQRAEGQVREKYNWIVASYSDAGKIVDPLTNQFYQHIYNIPEKDSFHVIKFSEFAVPPESKSKVDRLNDNLRIFSFDSPTPMAIFSTSLSSFTKIEKTNKFWDDLVGEELGVVKSIDQLILPELRQDFLIWLQQEIIGDCLSMQGQFPFILGAKQQLIAAAFMIQVVPSIKKGLRYAFFIKDLWPEKSLFIVNDDFELCYRSVAYSQGYAKCNQAELVAVLKEKSQLQNKKIQTVIFESLEEQLQVTSVQSFPSKKGMLTCYSIQKPTKKQQETNFSTKTAGRPLQNSTFESNRSTKPKRLTSYHFSKTDHVLEQETDLAFQAKSKLDKQLREVYAKLVDKNIGSKFRTKFNLVMFIGVIIVIVMFAACIFAKKIRGKQHYALMGAYERLSDLMVEIGDVATDLKLLNLYAYQNRSTETVYRRLRGRRSLTDLMDEAFSFFDYQTYKQAWTYLKLNSNGSFSAGSLSNDNAITDYLQLPLINLQSLNQSSFNFPFSLDYLTPPLNTTSIFFHNFVTNAIYFAIPKLRALSISKLIPTLKEQEVVSVPLLIFCCIIIAVIVICLVLLVLLQRKFYAMINFTHRFVEALSQDVIKQKKQSSMKFLNKYRPAHQETLAEQTVAIEGRETQQLFTPNLSRRLEDVTERELNLHQSIAQEQNFQQQLQDQVAVRAVQTQKRKKAEIFSAASYCKLSVFYCIPALFFIAFPVIFLIIQQYEKGRITDIMYLTHGIGFTLEDLVYIHLYSLHFGVYNIALQAYNNIAQALGVFIYEMFFVMQLLLTSIGDATSSNSKTYWHKVAYADICQAEQQGEFAQSGYRFEQRGNFTECSTMANEILTKGLIAAMLSYLEKANNLFLSNQMTITYTPEQKLQYLNDSFFSDTAKLLDYFKLILSKSRIIMREDISNLVDTLDKVVSYSSIILIVGLVLFLIFIRPMFINRFNQDIARIRGFFLVISHQTILQQKQLKEKFLERIDQLRELK